MASAAPLSRRLARAVTHIAGVALIGWVLWLVGWQDRVEDADGAIHHGRIVRQEEGAVVLRAGGEETRVAVAGPEAVRRGLAGAFRTLAARPAWALAGMAMHAAAVFCTFARWRVLLHGAGLPTPWRLVVRLGVLGQFFHNVLPGGAASGEIVRGAYIAREHPHRKTRAVLTILADRAAGLLALALIAAGALLLAPGGSRLDIARGVLAAVVLGGAACVALVVSPGLRRRLGFERLAARLPLRGVLREIEQAVSLYGSRPGVLAAAGGLALLAHALLLAAFFLYGRALGATLPALAVLVAIPVAQVLAAIPALPGGWGVGDFAFWFFLPAAGVAAATAVALSFTFRAAHTLLSLPGGFLLARGG